MLSIFSIPISLIKPETFSQDISRCIRASKQCQIVTLNPEILLKAKRSESYKECIQKCTHSVIDGFGIVLLARLRFGLRVARITGMDVVRTLCLIAKEHHLRIGCIGGKEGVSRAAAKKLTQLFPNAHIEAIEVGDFVSVGPDGSIAQNTERQIIAALAHNNISILFVGFGAPKQEFFMTSLQRKVPQLQVVAGIGGLLDVLSGRIATPPRAFRHFGLEWLWRLGAEPRRIGRILNALIVFPVYALLNSKNV